MRIIGTAGHVDHGKSSLVKALTGVNPDRLIEEQRREMTIELGFARMKLPSGQEISIIDVPGHRDFINHMLAGVGGMDVVLLVIAADEGVMPQTREHLAIINMLGIQEGILVLSKIDLVHDDEWIKLVEEDVKSVVAGTIFSDSPIVRVSAKTGEGLEELVQKLETVLSRTISRPDLNRPRLWIDRVFTMTGYGTVVTGTLLDGVFSVGDEVVILPEEKKARIRNLQTHNKQEEKAYPGTRTAVNLSGVDVDDLRRGSVLCKPRSYHSASRIDVHLQILPGDTPALSHFDQIKFFIGSEEVLGHARILGKDLLKAGEEGFLQLELDMPVTVVKGDRFIIRRPSPSTTIGGGLILNTDPSGKYRRYDERMLHQLNMLLEGEPEEVLLLALAENEIDRLDALSDRLEFSTVEVMDIVSELIGKDEIVVLGNEKNELQENSILVTSQKLHSLWEKAKTFLDKFHAENPLVQGVNKEEFRQKISESLAKFNYLMDYWVKRDLIKETGTVISLSTHTVKFSKQQQQLIDRLFSENNASPFEFPGKKECVEFLGEDLFYAAIDQKQIVLARNDVVFKIRDFNFLLRETINFLSQNETITVSQFRDHFGTSRKYALGFLEYLDDIGITSRRGDSRILKSGSKEKIEKFLGC